MNQTLALFQEFPELEPLYPRVPLVNGYTPIHELKNLQNTLRSSGSQLWIKRDDRSELPLGGNKARKLEFLLGEAKRRGVQAIVTSGGYGSNHALATALAGREVGLHVTLFLGPQPVTDHVRKKILAMHAAGAELHYHSQYLTWGLEVLFQECRSRYQSVFRLTQGGSSFVGTLGYVNAFFELKQQLKGKPFPKNIFLPVGTSGTAAGLLAGACLSGILENIRIFGVAVLAPLFIPSVVRKAEKILRTFEKVIGKPPCDVRLLSQHFCLKRRFYRPGYGAWNADVDVIVKKVRELEGIQLDETYSGKAMLGMLRTLQEENIQDPSLFWLTYNSYDLNRIISDFPWKDPDHKWRDLPKKFWNLFE